MDSIEVGDLVSVKHESYDIVPGIAYSTEIDDFIRILYASPQGDLQLVWWPVCSLQKIG